MIKKKILYISYDGMTDPLGQSQVLPYLVELAKHGYEFTLMSFEKKHRYKKEKETIESICIKAGINWEPLFFTENPPVVSKIYDRWRMKRKAIGLQKRHQFDMVHCRSYVAAEVGLLLKNRFGIKFLFDMRGFWADERVDNGQWNLKNAFFNNVYKYYKKKEKEFLKNADAIISLTYAAKKEITKQEEYSGLIIDVIPCCADLEHFDYNKIEKEQKEKLRNLLQIKPGKKIITYLGSVGGWYMTKEMFEFVNCLMQQYPEFVMLVLTKDEPAKVWAEAMNEGISPENLVVRYATRKELPVYISLSDCSIFFIRPTYSKIASSPTKHGELMGVGVPVICNNIGDTGFIIENTQTGFVINEFTKEEYMSSVKKIGELLSISKEHIRRKAFQYFNLEQGSASYSDVYKRVLNA